MKKVLCIHSSPLDGFSVSREISEAVITSIRSQHPNAQIKTRDLNQAVIPHYTKDHIEAAFTPSEARTPKQQQALNLSDELCKELMDADIIIIGSPMWNFSIPSVLKAWIDHIVRVGVTFHYTETGPKGLLASGKKVILVEASGGEYTEMPMKAFDFVKPYLTHVLNFIGIDQIYSIQAGGTAYKRDVALAEAKTKIEKELNAFVSGTVV